MSIDEILADPEVLRDKTLAEVQSVIGTPSGWKVETLGKGSHKGEGWVLREYTETGWPTGRMVRWHPGGGHHGANPYWRVSSHRGKSGVIPAGE